MIKRQEYESKVESDSRSISLNRGERREAEAILEALMTENFAELMKRTNPKIQKANKNLKRSKYDFIPRYFTIKLPRTKMKKRKYSKQPERNVRIL